MKVTDGDEWRWRGDEWWDFLVGVEDACQEQIFSQNVGDGPLFMLVSHRLLILTNHPSSRRGQLKRRHFTPRTA
jgi:hypothetical protein